MKRLIFVAWCALALVVAATPSAYAGKGHGGGGGGGGSGSTGFVLSVASTASFDQSAVQTADIVITRTGGTATNVAKCSSSVHWSTSNGTATSADYTGGSGTATVSAGQSSTTVHIALNHESDNADAADSSETFAFTISAPTSSCKSVKSALGTAVETVTITDGLVVLTVPDGQGVVLTNMQANGCNSLVATLETPAGPVALGGNIGNECNPNPLDSNQWKNSTGSAATVSIAVDDQSCSRTYFSDTTSYDTSSSTSGAVNHARVTPGAANVWAVDVADSGGGCEKADSWAVPAAGDGNFTGTLTLVASAPSAPANLDAQATGPHSVSLSWDAPSGADSYNVLRSASTGTETEIGTTALTHFTDTGLDSGTTYYYEVQAVNVVGTSDASSEASTQTFTLLDDLEGDTSGWSVAGNLWHLTNGSSCGSPGYASATHAFYYGQDGSCTFATGAPNSGTLTSPDYTVTGNETTASFAYDLVTEHTPFNELCTSSGSDLTRVSVSYDSGTSWVDATPTCVNDSNGWAQFTFPVAPTGTHLRFKFVFNSVDLTFNNYLGWMVDDLAAH